MEKERPSGFYWVKHEGVWTVGQYVKIRKDRFWQLVGTIFVLSDVELREIDETPIVRTKPLNKLSSHE